MTRILLVDDVKLFRHMEASVLGWRGYTIEEAASGPEALEKIRANPPDLVLMDFYMPGMTGSEVCQQVKSDPALAHLPIIIITSSSRDEDIRSAVQAGCDDFLSKPLDEATLVRKVESLLGAATKRRFPRVSASLQVSFEDFKGIFFEYSRDLSRSGVFIEMADPLPVGSRLRLSFALPPPFEHPVRAYGRVVRVTAAEADRTGGVGVSFIHVDDDSLRVIDALVAAEGQPSVKTDLEFSRLSIDLDQPEETPPPSEGLRASSEGEDLAELRNAMAEMRKDHLRLSAMVAICEGLHSPKTPREVTQAAVDVLHNLLGAACFSIFLAGPDDADLKLLAGSHAACEEAVPPLAGPLREVLTSRRVALCDPPQELSAGGAPCLALAPVSFRETTIGLIAIFELFPQKEALSAMDEQLLDVLGRHLGAGMVRAVSMAEAPNLDRDRILSHLR